MGAGPDFCCMRPRCRRTAASGIGLQAHRRARRAARRAKPGDVQAWVCRSRL